MVRFCSGGEQTGAEEALKFNGLFVAEDMAEDAHTVLYAFLARLTALLGFRNSLSGIVGHRVCCGRGRRIQVTFV